MHCINFISLRFRKIFYIKTSLFIAVFMFVTTGCKKAIQISPPANSITSSQVFADSTDAAAALGGIYSNLLYVNGGDISFCNGIETVYCGLSSDELVNFYSGGDASEFYLNSLQSTNGVIDLFFWNEPYAYIYQANACIEGLEKSTTISGNAKNQFLGEAKFLRAFFYFYLVNFFGDVPYIGSTDWTKTSSVARSSTADVYQKIIADLQDAQNLLKNDYSFSGKHRTRANAFAATALLARVYLYLGDWNNAAVQATSVINNTALFGLEPDLNSVFLADSKESILQWQLNTSYGYYNATSEEYVIAPIDPTQPPSYYLSDQLVNSFEPGDQRFFSWVANVDYNGTVYNYPNKYKVGYSQSLPGAPATEYYMVLRLAEQYLIRAEAQAHGVAGGVSSAISDLNAIRSRAGLSDYSGDTQQTDVLNAIYHERQIELFAEWGHRWFDLRRTGQIDGVMSVVTPLKNGGGSWNSYQQLYPIPQSELTLDGSLVQNPEY